MGQRKGYKQTPEHIANRIKRGVEHPNWKGDSVSTRGGRSRAPRLFPKIASCADCGSPDSERHHKDENTANNSPENIEFLCRSCHLNRHSDHTAEFVKKARLNQPRICQIAAEKRRSETHCKLGHPYTPENTYVNPRGARICKTCRSEYKREWRAKCQK